MRLSARLIALVASLLGGAIAALVIVSVTPAADRGVRAALRLGSFSLVHCAGDEPGFCGDIRRPLEPGQVGGPTIPIGFEFIPARDGAADSIDRTIVAVEGGPGYPSSGSRAEYLGTFGPQLAHHNLLMVDNRGTGDSAVIRCASLDHFPTRDWASGAVFARRVGACGVQLDRQYRTWSGQLIHGADRFGTEAAVSDLHVLLDRLGVGRVQLYGDSYGSWFAQAFMARYPGQLRSVVLDSTYAVAGLDPWYASSGSSGRAALNRVCARDLGCRRDGGPSTPVSRLAALLALIRRHRIRGAVPTLGGPRSIEITPRRMVDLFQDGGSDPYAWREFDASVRAALDHDPAPLLRLLLLDSQNGGDGVPASFSDGDYMAVSCTDYPQLFSRSATPAQRAVELRRSERHAPPGAFAPFTVKEWVTMSAYSETYDACLDWPAPGHAAPVLAPVHRRRLPASVPVLIIGGDLDDLTPLSDVRAFAPTLGRRVRVIDLVNTVHVTSEGDTYLDPGARCARAIIDRFLADPAAIGTVDTRCASRIPPVQTPGAYPRTLAAARPAMLESGPALSLVARRGVTVATDALADATIRHQVTTGSRGVGLRGGSWSVAHGVYRLHDVRFVNDATVSGMGRYAPGSGATAGSLIVSTRGLRFTVRVSFDARSEMAQVQVGTSRLELPAP